MRAIDGDDEAIANLQRHVPDLSDMTENLKSSLAEHLGALVEQIDDVIRRATTPATASEGRDVRTAGRDRDRDIPKGPRGK